MLPSCQVMVRSLAAVDLVRKTKFAAVAENDPMMVRVDSCFTVTAPLGTQRGGRSLGPTQRGRWQPSLSSLAGPTLVGFGPSQSRRRVG